MPMGKLDTTAKHQEKLGIAVGQINISVRLPRDNRCIMLQARKLPTRTANHRLSISYKITRVNISQANLFRKMVTFSTNNSLMYSKLPLEALRPRLVLDSTIDLVDRDRYVPSVDTLPNSTDENRAEQLLCDHATLLLSIADIAQSEITQCPSALLEDDDYSKVSQPVQVSQHHRRITPSSLPAFPKHLDGDMYPTGSKPNLSLLPRNGSLRHSQLVGSVRSQRHRLISFDSPTSVMKHILHPWESPVTSPLSVPRASPKHCRTPHLDDDEQVKVATITPKRTNKSSPYHQGSHKKARINSPPRLNRIDHNNTRQKKLLPQVSALLSPRITNSLSSSSSSPSSTKNTTNVSSTGMNHQAVLQGTPPAGTTARKVYRRKFSWKNFPQVNILPSIRCFFYIVTIINFHLTLFL